MQIKFTTINWNRWIMMLILTSGCEEEAQQLAREAADRQAQQNTAMAELNKEVASGTRRLVQADAKARQEIVGVHRDLQSERSRLDTGAKTTPRKYSKSSSA